MGKFLPFGRPDPEPSIAVRTPAISETWQQYSEWSGKAGERYAAARQRIGSSPGLGARGRVVALNEARANYDTELESLRSGPSYQQLRAHFDRSGGEGEMEDWYRDQFGGYEASFGPGGPESEPVGDAPIGGADDPARIAGVGPKHKSRAWFH